MSRKRPGGEKKIGDLGDLWRGGRTHHSWEDTLGCSAWLEGESLRSCFPPHPSGWRVVSMGQPHDTSPDSLGMPWATWLTPHSDRPPPWAPSRLDFLPPTDIDIFFFPASNEHNEWVEARHRSGTTWPFPAPFLHCAAPVVIPLPAFNSHGTRAWFSLAQAHIRTVFNFQALTQISPQSHLLEHPQEFKVNSRKS